MFSHIPPQIRATEAVKFTGMTAIKFPASLSLKIPHGKVWVIVEPTNSEGMVVKTHTTGWVILSTIAWLSKRGIEHEVIKL